MDSLNLAAQELNLGMDQRVVRIQFPMLPRDALVHLSKFLLDYEKTEILEYDQIYYLNLKDSRDKTKTPDGPENNGFDSSKGEYICDARDHIAYRFEIIERIGKGSFGQVFKCYDHKDN